MPSPSAVLAAVAAAGKQQQWNVVLVTSDRDSFALIDKTTSVLRILSGGVEASPVLTPERLQLMLGIGPHQYRDLAALRGDASDNLPGVPGIGSKTATKLLQALGSAQAAFDDLDGGGGNDVIKAVMEMDDATATKILDDAVAGIETQTKRIVDAGAVTVFAPDFIDVGASPALLAFGPEAAARGTRLSDYYNDTFDAMLDRIDDGSFTLIRWWRRRRRAGSARSSPTT